MDSAEVMTSSREAVHFSWRKVSKRPKPAGHGRRPAGSRCRRRTADRRGHEHGHRPAAGAGDRLDGVHVDAVDVRALFAVDLDVHEELVHQRGGGASSNDSCAMTWHQWQAL